MKILWRAVRAVSVETMGVLVVLWILYGATELAIDVPWWATKSQQVSDKRYAAANTQVARVEPKRAGNVPIDHAHNVTASDETQPASVRQWLKTLFPTDLDKTPSAAGSEQRAEYTRERLDYYGRLYGITWSK